MKHFDINSDELTQLKEFSDNKIVVREILVNGGDVMELFSPIKVETKLPTGESHSFYFHPSSFYSNYSKKKGTDMAMEFVIHYCPYTTLKIESDKGKKISFRMFYTKVEGELIVVLVKRDMDGYTFSLPAQSRELILSKFPNARPVRNVTVASDVKTDFEAMHGKAENYIIPALTDLKPDQLEELGGVKIIDATTGIELGKV